MEAVRDKWTDERLDDLNKKVDDGFADTRTEFRELRNEMKGEFRQVRGEMKEEFRQVRGEIKAESSQGRAEMKAGFREIRGEIRSQNRLVIGLYGTLIVALVVPHL